MSKDDTPLGSAVPPPAQSLEDSGLMSSNSHIRQNQRRSDAPYNSPLSLQNELPIGDRSSIMARDASALEDSTPSERFAMSQATQAAADIPPPMVTTSQVGANGERGPKRLVLGRVRPTE